MLGVARLVPKALPVLKKLAPVIVLLLLAYAVLKAYDRAETRGYERCVSETASQTKTLFEEAYNEQTTVIRDMPRDLDDVVERLLKAEFNNRPD